MRWQDGYPCDSGSTDGQDSARLAGLMQVFNHPKKMNYGLFDYVSKEFDNIKLFRHPKEKNLPGNKYSRDQLIPFAAGLSKAHQMPQYSDTLHRIITYKPENGDWLSPSHKNHLFICAGFKPSFVGDLWLWLDVLWSCFIDPMAESNQLICMMKTHPNKAYLKFWCKWNKQWANSIRNYWSENEGAWRGEPELAELMIKTIEGDVK